MSRRQPPPSRSSSGVARRLTFGARAAALFSAAALLGAVPGCANHNSVALAREACRHVERSLAIYRSAQSAPSPAESARQSAKALQELRIALPIAASAAGQAEQWQGLMATLAESTRVPESELVSALQAQCATASGS